MHYRILASVFQAGDKPDLCSRWYLYLPLVCKWINVKFQFGYLHEGNVYQITVSYKVWVVLEVKISVFLG